MADRASGCYTPHLTPLNMPLLQRFMPSLRRTRVPLPAKVFLSYLVVVLVGALPTYLFVYRLFLASFMTESVRTVAVHAQLLANFLGDYDSAHQRVEELKLLGPTMVERLTYISSSGRVLLESALPDAHSLDNHLARPEIERALGKLPPDDKIDVVIPRVGISRRPADATGIDTVYVAVRLAQAQGTEDFLRLGVPISELDHLSGLLLRVLRNSQAAAVTASIFLSLLAAVLFLRPLQRLVRVAQALARGDYTVAVGDLGQDEIGDVGRSLEQLGRELRKRLAVAQAGEAMLVQLVHGMHFPMAVFGSDGNIIAINGAARDAFSRQQSTADANFAEFVKSADFLSASKAAHEQGEPVHLTYSPSDKVALVSGWVHMLHHPAGPPFCAFLGEEAVRRPQSRLPRPSELRPVALKEVITGAQERAKPMLLAAGVRMVVESKPPETLLCDNHDRLTLALMTLFCGVAPASGASVAVTFVEKATRVAVVIYAPITDAAVETAAHLLTPIGGRVKNNHRKCMVSLAKA